MAYELLGAFGSGLNSYLDARERNADRKYQRQQYEQQTAKEDARLQKSDERDRLARISAMTSRGLQLKAAGYNPAQAKQILQQEFSDVFDTLVNGEFPVPQMTTNDALEKVKPLLGIPNINLQEAVEPDVWDVLSKAGLASPETATTQSMPMPNAPNDMSAMQSTQQITRPSALDLMNQQAIDNQQLEQEAKRSLINNRNTDNEYRYRRLDFDQNRENRLANKDDRDYQFRVAKEQLDIEYKNNRITSDEYMLKLRELDANLKLSNSGVPPEGLVPQSPKLNPLQGGFGTPAPARPQVKVVFPTPDNPLPKTPGKKYTGTGSAKSQANAFNKHASDVRNKKNTELAIKQQNANKKPAGKTAATKATSAEPFKGKAVSERNAAREAYMLSNGIAVKTRTGLRPADGYTEADILAIKSGKYDAQIEANKPIKGMIKTAAEKYLEELAR